MKSIKLNLDDALHRRLKVRAAMEGISMQDLLVKLIEKHLSTSDRARKVASGVDERHLANTARERKR